MRVIAKKTLREFWEKYPDSEQALKSWYREASKALWNNPSDIKRRYNYASIIRYNRVVYNICGNKYRLITEINYQRKMIFIRFIGNHNEYDRIDAQKI